MTYLGRLGFLSVLCGASALAQPLAVPSFELERLRLSPGARDGLLVGGGDLLPRDELRLSLTTHYEHDPLVYRAADGAVLARVVGSRFTLHLAGAWSPAKWLEVGLQIPVVVWQGNSSGLSDVSVAAPQGTALGTPYLQARFGLLRETDGKPLDLSLNVAVGVPLGSEAALTRDSTVSALPSIGAGKVLGSLVRVGANLGVTIRGNQPLSPGNPNARDTLGSQFDVGVGATTLGDGLRGELSLRSAIPFTHAPAGTEVMLGARYPLGDFELYGLAGPGFGRLPGTPVFRLLMGAAWVGGRKTAPPPPACVEGAPYSLAECPDLDVDGDGVRNGADACPEVKGRAATQGCPDADEDGVVDAKDECPAVKGPAALNGCPDSDEDGLVDAMDECPTEAGPSERKGCPLKDSDGDGVLDDVDACPAVPGVVERQGCPVPDTDGDGVADDVDNCPKVMGVPENQGCPGEEKQLVVITREKLVIKDKVYFDTGKSKIQRRSFGLLNQVARILIEHPDVRRVVVEGHTDSRGAAEMNRKLSQDRAEAVKAYLVEHGVEATRLEAKGYGPDRPVADNGTAAGREQNRRVEFVIATEEKVETHPVEPQ
ncbi:MAG: OmpA family protein [Myxococcota bacterium]